MHRVERDDAVRNAEFFQKLLRRRNFVGFLVDFDMRQRRVGGEGAEYLLRPDVVEGVKTSLENLAVERQSANAGNRFVIVQLRGVIPKGLLDILRSQPLQNETDRSVRGRFPPIDLESLVQTPPMNRDESPDAAIRVRSCHNRQNRKEQNVRQLIEFALGAAWVGDRCEQRKKTFE